MQRRGAIGDGMPEVSIDYGLAASERECGSQHPWERRTWTTVRRSKDQCLFAGVGDRTEVTMISDGRWRLRRSRTMWRHCDHQ